MTTVAQSSQGAKVYLGNTGSPNDYTAIPGVISISGPSAQNPEIDASDLDSTAKEFIPGLTDNGEVALKLNYASDNTVHRALRTAFIAVPATTKQFVIEFTDTAPVTRWEFQGFIKTFAITMGVDAKVEADVSIRVTGAITQYN